MMPIKSHMETYIDSAVEKAATRIARSVLEEGRAEFKAEIKRDRELLLDGFRSEIKTMGETVDLRIRDITREVIREEVNPRFEILETKMDMVVVEIKSMKSGLGVFKEEMRALRLDVNRHDKRLSRLEHARA